MKLSFILIHNPVSMPKGLQDLNLPKSCNLNYRIENLNLKPLRSQINVQSSLYHHFEHSPQVPRPNFYLSTPLLNKLFQGTAILALGSLPKPERNYYLLLVSQCKQWSRKRMSYSFSRNPQMTLKWPQFPLMPAVSERVRDTGERMCQHVSRI